MQEIGKEKNEKTEKNEKSSNYRSRQQRAQDSQRRVELSKLETEISKLEENATALSNVSRLFDEGKTLEEIADIALKGIEYDIFDVLDVEYKCDCSKDRMHRALISVGEKDLREMLAEQVAEGKAEELEISCRFCNKAYSFKPCDLGL